LFGTGRWQFNQAAFPAGVIHPFGKKAPHLFQCGASPVNELTYRTFVNELTYRTLIE